MKEKLWNNFDYLPNGAKSLKTNEESKTKKVIPKNIFETLKNSR